MLGGTLPKIHLYYDVYIKKHAHHPFTISFMGDTLFPLTGHTAILLDIKNLYTEIMKKSFNLKDHIILTNEADLTAVTNNPPITSREGGIIMVIDLVRGDGEVFNRYPGEQFWSHSPVRCSEIRCPACYRPDNKSRSPYPFINQFSEEIKMLLINEDGDTCISSFTLPDSGKTITFEPFNGGQENISWKKHVTGAITVDLSDQSPSLTLIPLFDSQLKNSFTLVYKLIKHLDYPFSEKGIATAGVMCSDEGWDISGVGYGNRTLLFPSTPGSNGIATLILATPNNESTWYFVRIPMPFVNDVTSPAKTEPVVDLSKRYGEHRNMKLSLSKYKELVSDTMEGPIGENVVTELAKLEITLLEQIVEEVTALRAQANQEKLDTSYGQHQYNSADMHWHHLPAILSSRQRVELSVFTALKNAILKCDRKTVNEFMSKVDVNDLSGIIDAFNSEDYELNEAAATSHYQYTSPQHDLPVAEQFAIAKQVIDASVAVYANKTSLLNGILLVTTLSK